MFKSSLTTSLIAGILALPSLNRVAQAQTSTKEIEKTANNLDPLITSTVKLDNRNESKTATLPKILNSVGSVRTLIASLSSLSSAKKYSANASTLDRTNAKLVSTSIEPKTINFDARSTTILANKIATTPESSTALLAAKPSQVHVVSPGDTISKIARQYGVSKNDLVKLNQLKNSNIIFVSQRLQIPSTDVLPSTRSPNVLQQDTQITSFTPVEVTNQERDRATSSSDLNSDRQTTKNFYLKKLEAEKEQSPNQQQQTLQANRNASAPKSLKSSFDSDLIVIEDVLPKIETVSAVSSPRTSNSQTVSLPENSIALQLPPLPPSDEYLPTAFDGYIWPTQGILTSGYGWRWGRMHRGIDIAAPIGTPIVAAAAGEVIISGWQSGYGNVIKLKHLDGSVTVYGHNHVNLVTHGQKVEQGEQIAQMGNTGRSTGPHLHFEIRPAGEAAIDPLALLESRK